MFRPLTMIERPPEPEPEASILSAWFGEACYPMLSIICHTYNHAPYVRDALNGFLMQDTEFPFEIIVHDDASTDGTSRIIKEYAERYPNIINPILQSENQRSCGVRPISITAPKARGRYVALCEGDDFWTERQKLQVQVAALEKNPRCDMCFHPAIVVYDDRSRSDEYRSYLRTGDRLFGAEEIIRRGGGFCPTASHMYRGTVLDRLPSWFFTDAPVGDQFLQIFGALQGGAWYIDRPMAVYRRMTDGSWSDRMRNLEYELKHNQRRIACLKRLNGELGYRYDASFRYQEARWLLRCAYRHQQEGNIKEFREFVERSWRSYPGASHVQRAFYWCRRVPVALRALNVLEHVYTTIHARMGARRGSAIQ